jgi:hypothetical protein
MVTFLTQTSSTATPVSEQRVFDYEITNEAQTYYEQQMAIIQYALLDGRSWTPTGGVGDQLTPTQIIDTVRAAMSALNAWSRYKYVNDNGNQVDTGTYPTSFSSPSTMSRYMAQGLDSLIRTLSAAGFNPIEITPDYAQLATAVATIQSDDLSSTPIYNIRSVLSSAISAAANAVIVGDSSTQSQSIQQLLMIDYVQSGNTILYNEMNQLQTAVNLNQQILSYLNSLQDLMNQKDAQHFLMSLQDLNSTSPNYALFEKETFGDQVLGTTPKFTDATLTQYVTLMSIKSQGLDPDDPLIQAQYNLISNDTQFLALLQALTSTASGTAILNATNTENYTVVPADIATKYNLTSAQQTVALRYMQMVSIAASPESITISTLCTDLGISSPSYSGYTSSQLLGIFDDLASSTLTYSSTNGYTTVPSLFSSETNELLVKYLQYINPPTSLTTLLKYEGIDPTDPLVQGQYNLINSDSQLYSLIQALSTLEFDDPYAGTTTVSNYYFTYGHQIPPQIITDYHLTTGEQTLLKYYLENTGMRPWITHGLDDFLSELNVSDFQTYVENQGGTEGIYSASTTADDELVTFQTLLKNGILTSENTGGFTSFPTAIANTYHLSTAQQTSCLDYLTRITKSQTDISQAFPSSLGDISASAPANYNSSFSEDSLISLFKQLAVPDSSGNAILNTTNTQGYTVFPADIATQYNVPAATQTLFLDYMSEGLSLVLQSQGIDLSTALAQAQYNLINSDSQLYSLIQALSTLEFDDPYAGTTTISNYYFTYGHQIPPQIITDYHLTTGEQNLLKYYLENTGMRPWITHGLDDFLSDLEVSSFQDYDPTIYDGTTNAVDLFTLFQALSSILTPDNTSNFTVFPDISTLDLSSLSSSERELLSHLSAQEKNSCLHYMQMPSADMINGLLQLHNRNLGLSSLLESEGIDLSDPLVQAQYKLISTDDQFYSLIQSLYSLQDPSLGTLTLHEYYSQNLSIPSQIISKYNLTNGEVSILETYLNDISYDPQIGTSLSAFLLSLQVSTFTDIDPTIYDGATNADDLFSLFQTLTAVHDGQSILSAANTTNFAVFPNTSSLPTGSLSSSEKTILSNLTEQAKASCLDYIRTLQNDLSNPLVKAQLNLIHSNDDLFNLIQSLTSNASGEPILNPSNTNNNTSIPESIAEKYHLTAEEQALCLQYMKQTEPTPTSVDDVIIYAGGDPNDILTRARYNLITSDTDLLSLIHALTSSTSGTPILTASNTNNYTSIPSDIISTYHLTSSEQSLCLEFMRLKNVPSSISQILNAFPGTTAPTYASANPYPLGADSVSVLLHLISAGLDPTDPTIQAEFGLTQQDLADYQIILKIKEDGLDPSDSTVQAEYHLEPRSLVAEGTSSQAFIDIVSGQFNGADGFQQIIDNLTALIEKAKQYVDSQSGSSVVTELSRVLLDFQGAGSIQTWVTNFTDQNEGTYQSHLNNAITASQALNDTEREQLQQVMFVYQEFYQSASSMLNSLNQLLQTIASNISSQ